LNRLAGGWSVNGFLTAQGGRPFTVYSGFNTLSNVVQSTADCSGCTRADGRVFTDPQQGLLFYLDAAERARFATPPAGSTGSTGRNFFRGPGGFIMSSAFAKRIAISERFSLDLRADISNLTNTPTFGFPTTTVSAATFGRIRDTVVSASRKIQLGAKFSF
jgi:hypothetical protein